MMLRRGNFVKVKQNTRLESGEIVNNWVGEVEEIYQKENNCLITFDAQTIDSLDDSYLKACIEEGAEAYEYVFNISDLEKTSRRDTDEQALEALVNLGTRIDKLMGGEETAYEELKEKWLNEFLQDQYFLEQSEFQKENSSFIIEVFMEFMFNYEYVTPDEWTPYNVEEVCLNVVPRKITAEIELFENYGIVIQQFFKFLKEKKYIHNAGAILKSLIKITPKIAKKANNSDNWGMAKSLMMGAQNSGIDVSNDDELQKFVMNENLGISAGNKQNEPIKGDPFKGIERNQKISVKYEDGKIVEDIKFKKVEQDLKNGKCVICEN